MAFFNVFKRKTEFALTLERILGFLPQHLQFYQQAFTHKSVIKDTDKQFFESNERLEFLGDAILSAIVSHYLFNKFPFEDEGFLTQLRSRLVSRKTLNDLGVKIGLNAFVKAKLDKESKTIYGDALEALIGAIYLDRGYSYAEKFVVQQLIQTHLDIDAIIQTETDFKSRVLEWTQREKQPLEFRITEQEEKNTKLFTAELFIDGVGKGKGTAYSKKKAEQLAAEQFFKEIKE
ncbi:MAG: ribonuclease III [Vicingus serpentipes]|nr:ribonuclease III [Vicingus serpentipes]